MELEKQVSKAEILERYLNSAYFGHRAYGIFAAAQVFFSKTPKNLTLVEAATLAGLVKAPVGVRPGQLRPAGGHATGATTCIDQMAKMGYLSPARRRDGAKPSRSS